MGRKPRSAKSAGYATFRTSRGAADSASPPVATDGVGVTWQGAPSAASVPVSDYVTPRPRFLALLAAAAESELCWHALARRRRHTPHVGFSSMTGCAARPTGRR